MLTSPWLFTRAFFDPIFAHLPTATKPHHAAGLNDKFKKGSTLHLTQLETTIS
jgi:hypothetical protein